MKKIAICSDHGGFELKEKLKAAYPDIEWMDVGTDSTEPCDYPDYAFTLAMAVAGGYAPLGVSICGAANGAAMALNRHPYIRAAICSDAEIARLSRDHNDANVLCLAGRFQSLDVVRPIFETFINTPFSNEERHIRRIRKLSLQGDEGDCCDHDHGDGHDHHDHDHGPGKDGCCGGGCH